MLPWEFDRLEAKQKGQLLAIYAVNKEIEYYYHKESMRDIDRKHLDKGRGKNQRMVKPKGR